MNSIIRSARLPLQSVLGRRTLQLSATRFNTNLDNFDPNNYDVPLRKCTMDDLPEPYGSWKTAYEAERKRDGLYMPNLDNIMEETESYHVDKEGRITV